MLLLPEKELSMNQVERIEKLKAEVRRLNGGEDPPSFGLDTMPKDMGEQFLERIIAVETGQAANKIAPVPGVDNAWHLSIPIRKPSN
jgi:hypothetical protein